MATVDGYYEGPNQKFDFWTIDDEFNDFSPARAASTPVSVHSGP
jgi:hypothetical protein